jgi:hypothetical protein
MSARTPTIGTTTVSSLTTTTIAYQTRAQRLVAARIKIHCHRCYFLLSPILSYDIAFALVCVCVCVCVYYEVYDEKCEERSENHEGDVKFGLVYKDTAVPAASTIP